MGASNTSARRRRHDILVVLLTVLIAGIPAAVYERIRGLKASTVVSLGIWLVATVLLSLPTIMRTLSSD